MDILTALVPLVVPVALPLLIALSVAGYQFFMQRSPANVHHLVNSVASTVVQSTEQYYDGVNGASKKLAAERDIVAILSSLHINVSEELVNAALESAVYAMNQEQALWASHNTKTQPEASPSVSVSNTLPVTIVRN